MGNSKKSEIVKEIFKWVDKKCKNQKKRVEITEKEYEKAKKECHYEDEESYIVATYTDLERERAKLDALVDIKIGIEKYMRKCRHEEEEEENK